MATIATRIGPADHGRRMTLEEYLDAEEEEGYRYELARGVLEVSRVPGDRHGHVVCNLYDCVSLYRRLHPGVVLRFGGGNEFQFLIPEMISGRNPDLAVVLRNSPKEPGGRIKPVLAAEVVSARSGDRDYRVKREEYLAYGIIEYWIVDFGARKFTLLTRDGDVWQEQVIPDEQAIPSIVLPGLATTVAELWANLDFYDAEDDDETNLRA